MSFRLRDLKMGLKLTVFYTAIVLFGVAFILAVVAYFTYSLAENSAEKIASETTRHYTEITKEYLNKPFDEIRGIATTLERQINSGEILDRYKTMDVLKDFAARNDYVVGSALCFEPDAFDGKDSEYINADVHDETGRYIPYAAKDSNGNVGFEKLVDYEVEGAGDWYLIPKRTNKETIVEPYIYNVAGNDVLMTSLMVPFKDTSGSFIGVITADIAIDEIDKKMGSITIFDSGFVNVASADGYILSTKNKDLIGKDMKDLLDPGDKYLEKTLSGEAFFMHYESELYEGEYIIDGVSFDIGNTGTKWNVSAQIPVHEINKQADDMVFIIILMGIVIAVVVIIVSFLIARSFSVPINKGVDFARAIAGGNLTADIDFDRNDEIGILARELKNMKKNLTEIISDIKNSAELVASGSREISTSSQQISSGANEQAASTEEISSSMEELVANIQQNSENAKKSDEIARKAAEEAGVGGSAVNQTVQAMNSIAEKIGVIEDIARNTNMLALNAAIEAARAGDAGKGFAVVASEVRKLAENSQKAAAEITDISGSSVEAVENAEKIIMELIPQINQTSELVKDIASASQEQDNGSEQINSAIMQFDGVIQQNVSASEEMSAMAENLSSQADHMINSVSFFKMDNISALDPAYNTDKNSGTAAADRGNSGNNNLKGKRIKTNKAAVLDKELSSAASVRSDFDIKTDTNMNFEDDGFKTF